MSVFGITLPFARPTRPERFQEKACPRESVGLQTFPPRKRNQAKDLERFVETLWRFRRFNETIEML
jgi:hypothetical protein